jgi:hypothetical protein
MTTHDRDKIIAAAKECGFAEWENTDSPEFLAVIAEFYAISFDAGRNSVDTPIALAEAYRCGEEAGRVAEREECAKICDKYTEFSSSPSNFAENCAKSIRARSTK